MQIACVRLAGFDGRDERARRRDEPVARLPTGDGEQKKTIKRQAFAGNRGPRRTSSNMATARVYNRPTPPGQGHRWVAPRQQLSSLVRFSRSFPTAAELNNIILQGTVRDAPRETTRRDGTHKYARKYIIFALS
jgi:hypothetical protein